MIEALLLREGHDVTMAENGEIALRIFDDSPDHFELVITDLIMPQMGGFELAKALRSRRADLPILFVSGYAPDTPETLDEGTQLLSKPFEPSALSRMMRELVEG